MNHLVSHHPLVHVSDDGLSASYHGQGHHLLDVATVRASLPIEHCRLHHQKVKVNESDIHHSSTHTAITPFSPCHSYPIYYFEVHIQNIGARGNITIGLASKLSQAFATPLIYSQATQTSSSSSTTSVSAAASSSLPSIPISASSLSLSTSSSMSRQIGMDWYSVGYRGDDGKLYRGGMVIPALSSPSSQLSTPLHRQIYGPTFKQNDVIGCGVNMFTRNIFFTHNGNLLAEACALRVPDKNVVFHPSLTAEQKEKEMREAQGWNNEFIIYPAVSLHSQGEHITCNLGKLPFKFNVQKFVEDEYARINHLILRESFLTHDICLSLVKSYLVFQHLQQPLHVLMSAYQENQTPEKSKDHLFEKITTETIEMRKVVCTSILQANIEKAMLTINSISHLESAKAYISSTLTNDKANSNSSFSQLLFEKYPHLEFLLKTLVFIRLVQHKQLSKALTFAQENLRNYLDGPFHEAIVEVLGILKYSSQENLPKQSYLFAHSHLEYISDEMNRCIVSFFSDSRSDSDSPIKSKMSSLEYFIRQYWNIQKTLCNDIATNNQQRESLVTQ